MNDSSFELLLSLYVVIILPTPLRATVDVSSFRFAQTYASCIDQSYIHLFLTLLTTISFVVMDADYTSARANALLSSQPTCARLMMPTPTVIALAMKRTLTARWGYQCPRLCRDTPKLMLYGRSSSTRSSTTSISCTPHTSKVSTEVRSTGRSSFYADRSTTSLSFAPTLLWRKAFVNSLLLCKPPRSLSTCAHSH
jgi:hypothetical protein